MNPLYRPFGKALEYCEYAVNLYTGCAHDCTYCYVPSVLHVALADFHAKVEPRHRVLESLERQLRKLHPYSGNMFKTTGDGSRGKVLFCFTCDPYPVGDNITTREAIKIVGDFGYTPVVLTKGGNRAVRDFDLLKKYGGQFGATLTFYDFKLSRQQEPLAALPMERIEALREAHVSGIFTWVSLEPVIDPDQTYQLIGATRGFVDHYKIGKLNYRQVDVDWRTFVAEAKKRLEGKDVYWKESLREYL